MKFILLALLFVLPSAYGACVDVWKTDLKVNLKNLSPALQANLSDDSQEVNLGRSVGDLLQHNEILPKVKFEMKFIRFLSGLASKQEAAFLYHDYLAQNATLDLNLFIEKLDTLLINEDNFCTLDEEFAEMRPKSQKEIFELF
jgi:hypothetical protein